MHENLKMRFSFSLKKGNDDDKNQLIWQPIAGRVDHGTFYMIYMRYVSKNKNEIGGIVQYNYCFDFKIQNYEGAVTIGLKPTKKIDLKEFDPNRTEEKDTYDFELPIVIEPFSANSELLNVSIPSTVDLSSTELDVNILLQEPPIAIYNPSSEKTLQNSEYVDPSRWLRDGEVFLEINYKDPNNTNTFKEIFNEEFRSKLSDSENKKLQSKLEILDKMETKGFGRGNLRCHPKRILFTK